VEARLLQHSAYGIREHRRRLIAIEPGGSVKHKRLGTRNISATWNETFQQRVSELVTTIKGCSFDPTTIAAVNEMLGAEKGWSLDS